VPDLRYLKRLARRNDFLIQSHHLLRETLIAQMGATDNARTMFLQQRYDEAASRLVHTSSVPELEEPAF
jgi:hypothetical protein